MSWGITFVTDIFLSRITFENIDQVEYEIDGIKAQIQKDEDYIKMLSASNLRDIVPKEWEDDRISWLLKEVNHYFESIKENTKLLVLLELYLKYLNKQQTKQ